LSAACAVSVSVVSAAFAVSVLLCFGSDTLVPVTLAIVPFVHRGDFLMIFSSSEDSPDSLSVFLPSCQSTSFLINENILGKCFRSRSSCYGPRISPLTYQYGCPRLILLIITSIHKTNKIEPKSYSIIPC